MEFFNVLVDCGGLGFDVPAGVFRLTHIIVLLIQIAVPILLIIWGMLDFAKATIGGDEDAIKKGQKIFIKRLIAAIIVFLIVTIVTIVLNAVHTIGAEGDSTGSVISCINTFVRGA